MNQLAVQQETPSCTAAKSLSFEGIFAMEQTRDGAEEASTATSCDACRPSKGLTLTESTLDALPDAESLYSDSDSCESSDDSEASEPCAGDIEQDFEYMESTCDHYVYETSESSSDDEDVAPPKQTFASEAISAQSTFQQAPLDLCAGMPKEQEVEIAWVTAIMLQHVPCECTEGDLLRTFHDAGFAQPSISVKVFAQGSTRKFALVKFDSHALSQRFFCTFDGARISDLASSGILKPLVLIPVEVTCGGR